MPKKKRWERKWDRLRHELKLDEKGRVMIPREVREALGIKPGESLRLTVEGDKMVLTRPMSPEEFLKKKRRHKGGISAPANRPPIDEEDLGSPLINVDSNYWIYWFDLRFPEHEAASKVVEEGVRD